MKIIFVLPTVNMSGGIRVVSIYAEALKNRGHQVLLVSPPQKKMSFMKKCKALVRGKGWLKTKSKKSHLDNIDVEHKILDVWRPVVDADVPDADMVIATWWETAEWVMSFSAAKGAKVYFVQGYEMYPHLPVDRVMSTYKMPMHKIVIAKWLERKMALEYCDNKTDLVTNSIERKFFYPIDRNKNKLVTVGFLYSHSSNKGVNIALQVIDNIRSKITNVRIICFGSVMPNNDTHLDVRIEFFYLPEQAKIREIYNQCDIWLTASKVEGFNLPAMEAMACGTPVVSTKAGWPEEVILNMKNGYLADVDDVNTLSDAAIEILSLSEEKWKEMSQNAIETTKGSSWEESSKLFEKALVNACVRSRKGEIAGRCSDSIKLTVDK